MNSTTDSGIMNMYQEAFQKFSKKSKSYDNTSERKGAASINKKDSYKHVRSMKREWREE